MAHGPGIPCRGSIALLLVFAVGAGAAPASAVAPRDRKIAALESKVKSLKRRLHRERSARQAANVQIRGLTEQLTARTVERDRAAARAATLQAQIASRPSELARAVEQVRREVAHSEQVLESSGVAYTHEPIVAHAAMTYVVGHVSAPGYGYMNVTLGTHPLPTAESALATGSGICGNAALTFAAIVKRFNVPVRSVQFYYADGINNHIADEAYYGGAWHYYDPTWGAFYADAAGRVLSIDEARAHPDPRSLLKQDDTLLWRGVQTMAGVAPLGAETDPSTLVELDKQPFHGR